MRLRFSWNYSWKRILYTLCFFLFCVIDQRIKTCSGRDGWLETFRELTGAVTACLILSGCRLEEFRRWKLPYLIWGAAGVLAGAAAFLWGMGHRPFLNHWFMMILDVFLFGFVAIHTFLKSVWERRRVPEQRIAAKRHLVPGRHKPPINRGFLAAWALMMLLMVLSRSDSVWPLCYFALSGCLFLTDFTEEEQADLFHGALNGILAAFFVFQGLCFVFRPYDMVRYMGFYHNSNLNSLFYLEVLAAVFVKILWVTKQNGNRWVRIYYWLGAGTVLSFLFMTIGRTAWMTAFVMGILFLLLLGRIRKSGNPAKSFPLCFLKNGAVLVLCMCLTFPLCFGAVRYLPPLFHHPVWFWGEYSEERVHSYDPWDSEKYVDSDEFFQAALGRISDTIRNLMDHSPFSLKADAASAQEEDDRKKPLLESEQELDSLLTRGTIYQYYLTHLNLTGHPYKEQGFQLTPTYWIGHAHNIYLQYGTDFGIPVMLLFIALIAWSFTASWRRSLQEESEIHMAAALFILIPALFGMLEYSWGVGSLSITMLFAAWRQVCRTRG